MGRKRNQSNLPSVCITIRTYVEFEKYVKLFATGKLTLLLIIGPSGTAKSQIIRRALAEVAHLYIGTTASAIGIYQLVYQHLNQPVVLDDLDSFYRDKNSVRVAKSLCNTDSVRLLQWATKHPSIGNRPDQTPPEYMTNSPVCLVANKWETIDENVRAIEDRAIVINFVPSAQQIHVKAGEWVDDWDVYEFIGQHLHLMVEPSMRHYVKGKELRQAGLSDWRESVLRMAGATDEMVAIWDISNDPKFTSESERVAEFGRRGFGTRSTYFAWKQKMPRPEIVQSA